MNHFEIKSKVYCNPSRKTRTLYVVVNIAVIVMVVYSVVLMLVKGVNVGSISGCIVAIVVGFLLRSRSSKEGYYEFCILSIDIAIPNLTVSFLPNFNKQVIVDMGSIKTIEYSEQLQCVRLVCDYQEINKSGKEIKPESELLLYITYEDNLEFYDLLESATKKVLFVDR